MKNKSTKNYFIKYSKTYLLYLAWRTFLHTFLFILVILKISVVEPEPGAGEPFKGSLSR